MCCLNNFWTTLVITKIIHVYRTIEIEFGMPENNLNCFWIVKFKNNVETIEKCAHNFQRCNLRWRILWLLYTIIIWRDVAHIKLGTSLVDVQNAHLLNLQKSIIVACINELFQFFCLGRGWGGCREQLVFCWESRQIKQVFVLNIMHCRDSSIYVGLVDPLRYNLQTKSVSTSFLLQILICKKLLFL